MPFKKLGLAHPITQAIEQSGYTTPTGIQSQAIPVVLEGKDIIACAQTGTGKTAAFVLPILHSYGEGDGGKIHSLILTPTRELAKQIEDAVEAYSAFMEVRALALYGGVSLDKQVSELMHNPHIIIATPGRLLDLLDQGLIDLSGVRCLVLDEADRMVDMGFVREVKKIVSHTPQRERQTLLFSATISKDVDSFAKGMLRNPVRIQIGKLHNPVDSVEQTLYAVEKPDKMRFLHHLFEEQHMYSVLIFSRTKHGADRICKRLNKAKITAVAIHSNRTQNQRERALAEYRKGKFQVLVATDIAARGIDISDLTHVINYDIPGHPEDYVHRIGRTGRAQATGDAISLVSSDERESLRKIEKFIGKSLPVQRPKGFQPSTKEELQLQRESALRNAEKRELQREEWRKKKHSAGGNSVGATSRKQSAKDSPESTLTGKKRFTKGPRNNAPFASKSAGGESRAKRGDSGQRKQGNQQNSSRAKNPGNSQTPRKSEHYKKSHKPNKS